MKRIIYMFLALATLNLCACQEWLDVSPKTEIKKSELFETETGFENALAGSYLLLGSRNLYGKNLSVGLIEIIAHQYEETDYFAYTSLYDHTYANNTSIPNIWSDMYTVIANLNAIIGEVDVQENVLSATSYSVIKGEALALRAFCHFDLLRMFGWGNLAKDNSTLESLSIPYVLNYHKAITKQSSQSEVIELIKQDLTDALALLASYDPYSNEVKATDYSVDDEDTFYLYRKNRMNYYATMNTLARVLMWEGKYSEAYTYLNTLMESGKMAWSSYEDTIYGDLSSRDYKLYAEHLFSLDVYKLYDGEEDDNSDGFKPFFEQYYYSVGSFVSATNYNYVCHTSSYAKELFEVEAAGQVGLTDFRYDAMYKKNNIIQSDQYTFLKYQEEDDLSLSQYNKVPMMRLSEIYYSAAECLNEMGQLSKAVDLLNTVRINRGITYSNSLPYTLSKSEVDDEIMKEWQKDFIAEGQMFYYYKRLNKDMPYLEVSKEIAFVLPLPDDEIEIGYREDNIDYR